MINESSFEKNESSFDYDDALTQEEKEYYKAVHESQISRNTSWKRLKQMEKQATISFYFYFLIYIIFMILLP